LRGELRKLLDLGPVDCGLTPLRHRFTRIPTGLTKRRDAPIQTLPF
jgi:hypothetical protein